MDFNFVVPGSIQQISGGYIYDRKIIKGLIERGNRVRISELSGTFPLVDVDAICVAQKCIGRETLVVIDGLALPAFSKLLPLSQKVVALVHHPLYQETGLTALQSNFLWQQEKENLQKVNHIIVTSDFTKEDIIKCFDLKESNISVVVPGNEILPISMGSKENVIHFLAVGNVIPRKGYDLLLHAFSRLKDFPWMLNCIGSIKNELEMHKLYRIMEEHGLYQNVNFWGELEEEKMREWYLKSDIFVSASYYEGFGMAISEARSCGIPIISTTGGAVSKILNDQNALLCEPGDVDMLSQNLKNVIVSAELRCQLRKQSLQYRSTLKSWDDAAKMFEDKLLFDE